MSPALAGFAVGAALGGVPVSWLLHKAASGEDLRRVGSGNPGATNAWRAGGTLVGLLALAGDVLKGVVGVLLARRLAGDAAVAAAAFGACVGHVYTPWLGFRGGRGAAPAFGAFLVATPGPAACAAAAFAVAVATSRWISLGSIAGAAALALASAATARTDVALAAAATAGLVVWRHRENLARMRDGTEPRIGGGSRKGTGA